MSSSLKDKLYKLMMQSKNLHTKIRIFMVELGLD
jgi:hypothetical protein